MGKVAVVYWSATGNTEAMANEVAEGAKAAGLSVDMHTADAFNKGMVDQYDGIAFGCPSMGNEVLEESEFEPMYADVKGALAGKKVVLFGSYDWGDGQWMREWEEDIKDAGANLVAESFITRLEPDDEAKSNCQALGKALA